MSNTCWTNLWCRPEDRKVFEELGFRSEFEEDEFREKALHMISEYYIDATEEKGVPFVIEAGSTYEASPCSVVSDGETWMDGECNEQGEVVVALEEDGTIDQKKLDQARDFTLFRLKVLKIIGAVK